MSKSGEKQVFEDADVRQECGWQHCPPLPLGLFIRVSHSTHLVADERCHQRLPRRSADNEFREHMLFNLERSPSTVQTTDLVVTNE